MPITNDSSTEVSANSAGSKPISTVELAGNAVGNNPRTLGFAEKIATVGSLITGYFTGRRVIEERSYKNASSIGMWDDIKPKRLHAGAEILGKIKNEHLPPEEAHNLLKTAIQSDETIKKARIAELGSGSVLKQFSLLRSHQKWEVGVTTLASAGIALGSILLFTHEMFSSKDRNDMASKGNPSPDSEIQR